LVEDSIPRILANPPEILAYCSALSSVGTFLSTLLYFGSDALLVGLVVILHLSRSEADVCCSSSDFVCSARDAGAGSQFPAPCTSHISVRTRSVASLLCMLLADAVR
jgi:hypothetical protein